ncbi:hypothetical protein ACIRPH_12605 [Nocardiopsis sp. NPDC101807]|uniref:hypothetical protein n=1 Tax=Nocardiopsis sp. NPDC101807 TaxID=3364339 RepID=UPI0038041AE7
MLRSSRALVTTVLALGIALGAPAVASADARFHSQDAFAGPKGAGITLVRSVVTDSGEVSYEKVTYTAGPKGAGFSRVHSGAR